MNYRLQMFHVHAKKFKEKSFLGDVDFEKLARVTEGWSSDNILELVKGAFGHAVLRASGGEIGLVATDKISMEQQDFDQEIQVIQKQKRVPLAEFLKASRINGFVPCGVQHEEAYRWIKAIVSQFHNIGILDNCLLEGPLGTGKSSLAATIASESCFTYINVISNRDMISSDTNRKKALIREVLRAAENSSSSLIILDDIESLIEYSATEDIAHLLHYYLKNMHYSGKKIFVIGTTSDPILLKSAGIYDIFPVKVKVPELDQEGIRLVLKKVLPLGLCKDEDLEIAATKISHVPIKKLYLALGLARNDAGNFDESSLDYCINFLLRGNGKAETNRKVKDIEFCDVGVL